MNIRQHPPVGPTLDVRRHGASSRESGIIKYHISPYYQHSDTVISATKVLGGHRAMFGLHAHRTVGSFLDRGEFIGVAENMCEAIAIAGRYFN